MKVKFLYVGNIKKISKISYKTVEQSYNSSGMPVSKCRLEYALDDYKDKAVFIPVDKDRFVDIDTVRNIFDLLKLKYYLKKYGIGINVKNFILVDCIDYYSKPNELVVDRLSLKRLDLDGKVNILKVKKHIK